MNKKKQLQIKRNSALFKALHDYVNERADHPDKYKRIKLFSIKAYENPHEAVPLHYKSSSDKVIYDLQYDQLLFYFLDKEHKLFRDEGTGMYYFRTSQASKFIQSPFKVPDKSIKQK